MKKLTVKIDKVLFRDVKTGQFTNNLSSLSTAIDNSDNGRGQIVAAALLQPGNEKMPIPGREVIEVYGNAGRVVATAAIKVHDVY